MHISDKNIQEFYFSHISPMWEEMRNTKKHIMTLRVVIWYQQIYHFLCTVITHKNIMVLIT